MDGFKVFVGVEVTTIEDLDIIIIGERDHVRNLRDQSEMIKGNKMNIGLKALMDLCDPINSLIIIAHPYRDYDVFPKISKTLIKKFDAIELNAIDLQNKGEQQTKENVHKLSKELKLPIVCGSDSHHSIQSGSVKNKFSNKCLTIKDLKQQIKLGNFSIELSPALRVRVKCGAMIKRILHPKVRML